MATPRPARIQALELHLDVARRVEGELARLERGARAIAAWRELDDDRFVALDERVDEQLVRPRLEVEVLEQSTLSVIAIGVKYVDTSGWSTTIRSTQPVPWAATLRPRR